MQNRPYNFSAGPATMPEAVLAQAAAEMLDWQGSGMGVMEMSHRGKEFVSIATQAHNDIRELLAVPDEFHVLFMQGGGLGENAIVPMNLCGSVSGQPTNGPVLTDFVVTGGWSQKSAKEAARYSQATVVASNESNQHQTLPDPAQWRLSDRARYTHICSNETIHGVEFQTLPDMAALGSKAPLVVDCSSHIASRPMEWSKVGLAFAGAQKNLGPAGLTLVFVRDDLLDQAMDICPTAFNYKQVAANQSMYNTPPTYGIYMAGLVFQWLKNQGGVAAVEAVNVAKAELLYDCIDQSGLYENRVAKNCRSRMNVPFFLKDESLNDAFLATARERGLLQLKGHKSVGGMRASIYNAMPLEGVQALVDHMRDFEKTQA
ncbi:MAG: 3-phosphoserine/phosphohydroxythreonine transaminase [Polaromonas sp.]|nr:3-phosphoserine/phosphohydroxythreonine transaminase [Polaromonas sp.]